MFKDINVVDVREKIDEAGRWVFFLSLLAIVLLFLFWPLLAAVTWTEGLTMSAIWIGYIIFAVWAWPKPLLGDFVPLEMDY